MTTLFKPITTAFLTAFLLTSLATEAQEWKKDKKINVVFGLAQPVFASGFNVEVNYIHNRFIFDYSHGASLDYRGKLVPSELRGQKLAIHEPWTTGFGVGYRVREWINVRVEPKWHRFEFYYDGEQQNGASQITSYNTFTLGVGVYGSYQPFANKQNFLRGFLITPSVRFWPTIHSGLEGDAFTYTNKHTGNVEKIETLDAGSGFTPVVVNVSLGYSFSLKKKASR